MDNISIISIEKRPKSKKYNLITTKDDYVISEEIIVKYQLNKDKSFTEKEFNQLIEDILEDEYFNKVLNLLSVSYKSEYEIIKYIHDKEIKNKQFLKQKQIENIISKLKELNYIDDKRVCTSVIDYYIRNNKGPLFIKQKLKEKKIKEDLINECLMVYDDDIQSEIIVKILEKENNKNYTLKKFKNNLSNKLIRNGFSSSLVYKLIDRMQYDDNSELLIEKDFNKVYNRIKNKDKSENEKKQLIIQGLLSKGYEYSLIKKYLNESNFL